MPKLEIKSKLTLLLLLLSFITDCFIEQQTYIAEKDSGIWSQTTSAQPQIGQDPAQYFFVVIQYASKNGPNLFGIEKGIVSYKCEWCQNTFYSMRNGFKAIFCSINNWNIQVSSIIQTGNKDSRNWLTYKCPKGMYANRVAARFGCEQQTGLGLVGMQLNCSNLELNQSMKIQDPNKNVLSEISDNRLTNFISSFQIKYIEGGKITGIRFGFEGIPLITGIDISYSQIQFNSSIQTIEVIKLINNQKITTKQTAVLKNLYMIPNTFTIDKNNSYFSLYKIIDGITQPKLPSIQKSDKQVPIYTTISQKFLFGKQFFTKLSPIDPSIIVNINPLTNITVTIKTSQMKTNLTYQSTIIFSDKNTGQFITQKVIKGVWSGIISGSKTVNFQQTQCVGSWENNNCIVNADFSQNLCGTNYCVWDDKVNYSPIFGWTYSPLFQLGKGKNYNDVLGKRWIAQLNINKNTCIKQKIKLNKGTYLLSYDATCRVNYSLDANRFEVRLNGSVVNKFQPTTYYEITNQSYKFSILQNSKQLLFQFCGTAETQGYGGIINNIKLIQYNQCLTTNVDTY